MVQILFTVFGMGPIYENAQIIHNHGTLLHTTVVALNFNEVVKSVMNLAQRSKVKALSQLLDLLVYINQVDINSSFSTEVNQNNQVIRLGQNATIMKYNINSDKS